MIELNESTENLACPWVNNETSFRMMAREPFHMCGAVLFQSFGHPGSAGPCFGNLHRRCGVKIIKGLSGSILTLAPTQSEICKQMKDSATRTFRAIEGRGENQKTRDFEVYKISDLLQLF